MSKRKKDDDDDYIPDYEPDDNRSKPKKMPKRKAAEEARAEAKLKEAAMQAAKQKREQAVEQKRKEAEKRKKVEAAERKRALEQKKKEEAAQKRLQTAGQAGKKKVQVSPLPTRVLPTPHQVFKELNLARSEPSLYATLIKARVKHFKGKSYKPPEATSILVTKEGAAALHEAIRFLKSQRPMASLRRCSQAMGLAAMDHVNDQIHTRFIGHGGTDGSGPAQRLSRHGLWKRTCGECISYGPHDAREVVLQLIVDDGVPDRGHRKSIFNPLFEICGIGSGHHQVLGTMVCIDFAGDFTETGSTRGGNGGYCGASSGGASTHSKPAQPPNLAPARSDLGSDALERELSKIVGLGSIKAKLRQLKQRVLVTNRARVLGAPSQKLGSLHMIFQGAPGCGKTTIAKLMGRMLHEIGVLQSSKVVEVQRSDLVGEHIGATAPKTRKKVEEAKGGILFIDEAYALMPIDSPRDFGVEAITEVMRDMETGDPLIIAAGYPADMQRFMKANEGLKRRFAGTYEFPNFSLPELSEMFMNRLARDAYEPGRGLAQKAVQAQLEAKTSQTWRDMVNGGVVDKLYEAVIDELTARLDPDTMTREQASTIELTDVEAAAGQLETGA